MHARRGHSSIYHRKNGRWAAAMMLPDGRRKIFYADTREKVTRLFVQRKEESNATTGTG